MAGTADVVVVGAGPAGLAAAATARSSGLEVEILEAADSVGTSWFVPAPTTFVAGLAWVPNQGRFAEECLVVPTERLVDVAVDGGDRWVLNFHPESPERTPLDPYRRRLAQLGALVEQIAAD